VNSKIIPYHDFMAICDTKARYCRCLDEKDWSGYANTFTEEAVLDTRSSGGPEICGRESLVKMVRSSIETARTAHQVHNPEFLLVDDDTVDVIWAMQDRVVWDDDRAAVTGRKSLTGFGHYHDRYVRCSDGQWRIARSSLSRLHIDFEPFEAKGNG